MDNIYNNLDTIKAFIIKQINDYANINGISFPSKSLNDSVSFTRDDLDNLLKPKPKKIKFKPKKKLKLKVKSKPKANDYNKFIEMCNAHNLPYFQFFDENNWCGPAIKVNDSVYDITIDYFDTIDTKTVSGTDFYIIHPKNNLDDTIVYPKINLDSCKLENSSLMINGSDDEESIYNKDTEDEIVELDEWMHQETKYLIDSETNIVYSYQTELPIGKKIDEFTLTFY